MGEKPKKNFWKLLLTVLWLLLLAVPEAVLAPHYRLLGGVPRCLAAVTAAAAVAGGPGAGVAAGLLAGLLTDGMCGNTLCFYTVCYVLCGGIVGELMADFSGRGLLWSGVWTQGILLCTELLRFFLFFYLFGRADVLDALKIIGPELLYTLLLTPVCCGPVLLVFRTGKRERPLL